jgi:hypothetical protein
MSKRKSKLKLKDYKKVLVRRRRGQKFKDATKRSVLLN